MKHLFLSLLWATSTFTISAQAEIRETTSMAEAVIDAQVGDVVVFDIDNTIAEPAQTLGTDQWYEYLVHKNKASGKTEDQAIDEALRDWVRVQKVTSLRPVEEITPTLIQDLLAKKITVLGLTARPTALKESTTRQLQAIGVSLETNGYSYNDQKDIEFYSGVLFVGPKNNKGLVLADFFATQNISPRRLIFVDDKVKHVNNMDAVFAQKGQDNINFRYGAADARVKAFDSKIADYQWDLFVKTGELISDEDVK